ncbi:Uncharacterised protein [Mycobacteroides abscessus]|nr:Uncharacterised protein [Mycobacteroides abscessus]
MIASTVSERIESLSLPRVRISPLPSSTYCPRPSRRAIAASDFCETVAARILASSPSDRSGWRR